MCGEQMKLEREDEEKQIWFCPTCKYRRRVFALDTPFFEDIDMYPEKEAKK